jgi:hypothetical protein
MVYTVAHGLRYWYAQAPENTLPFAPDHERIDLEVVNQAIQPHVMAKATSFVDRARAETLFQFDEHDAAAVVEPYVYGETPEEVEVLLDEHGTPR